MIQKIPGLQDLWQCEIFGCYFFVLGRVLWGCGRGLQVPVEEHKLAAVTHKTLKQDAESRAALFHPSLCLLCCCLIQ